MTYSVKEMYYTLQGEGAQSGRPAVFCRFAGCNLWSGLEADRATATCTFCDTDFVGTDGENGGKFSTAEELADKIAALWPDKDALADAYVVFTGGEPLLQLDTKLLEACKAHGFETRCRDQWHTNSARPSGLGMCQPQTEQSSRAR